MLDQVLSDVLNEVARAEIGQIQDEWTERDRLIDQMEEEDWWDSELNDIENFRFDRLLNTTG